MDLGAWATRVNRVDVGEHLESLDVASEHDYVTPPSHDMAGVGGCSADLSIAGQRPNLPSSHHQRPQPNPPHCRPTLVSHLEGLKGLSRRIFLVFLSIEDPLRPKMAWVVGGTCAAGSRQSTANTS